VDQLYDQHVYPSDVLEAVQSRRFASAQLRTIAIEIANARADDVQTFSHQARRIVHEPGLEKAEYERILRLARTASDKLPDSNFCRATVAFAQFRLGDLDASHATLQEIEMLYAAIDDKGIQDTREHIICRAYLAMILQARRLATEAQAQFAGLEEEANHLEPNDREVPDILEQARQVLALRR
jgi:hypothetical protein